MTDKEAKPDRRPWPWRLPGKLVKPSDTVIFALQALNHGIANKAQQQLALAFIVNDLCEHGSSEFWPGGEDGRRASDFAGGKRFIAVQIQRLLALRPVMTNTRGAPPAMPAETTPTDQS